MNRPLTYDFDRSVGAWVVATARALERNLAGELERFGITAAQWYVLAALACHGGLHQAALAATIGIEPPTLCRTLDTMERNGWVERVEDPGDRRRKLIRPAARAKTVWRHMVTSARAVRRRATRDMSAEELATLNDLLARLRDNLNR
jgi:MarR family transcriptional regulator for hemolysin